MTLILLSKILENDADCRWCVAHFKGFVFGERVCSVLLNGDVKELVLQESYLLLLKNVKIIDEKLEATLVKQKALTKVLI